MLEWYKISLSKDDVMAGMLKSIQGEFDALFIAHNAQKDEALFAWSNPHGGIELYFTPAASILAQKLIQDHGGIESPMPRQSGLALLVGQEDAWTLLRG